MKSNMKRETRNKTGIMYNIIILLLILIIAVSSCIGIFAWAKYTSAINGTATAQVAKWSFKLVDGVTETTDVIDFAITRTDGYGKVVEGRLAPGTFGEFEIGIDARGTETILEYVINVELENKPTYLKLYSDEAKTQEILVEDNKFSVKGFMSLEDVEEIRTETIYWDWPYENGDDGQDTQDAGKLVTMKISVTGYEVLEPSTEEDEETLQTLADVVSIGDYVNYDASSNGTKTFTSSDCLTGSSISDTINTDDSFNSEAPAQWRVLSVDKTNGVVELMSTDPTAQTVTLSGGEGFVNAETVLNNVGAIYGQGKGAISGRSITLEDIEQYSSYDPYTYENIYSNTGYYGGTRTFKSGTFYKEIKDKNGNVINYETSTTSASVANPIIMTQTTYGYDDPSFFENSIIYNMIFKKSTDTNIGKTNHWLAIRCAGLHEYNCFFGIRNLYGVSGQALYSSDGSALTQTYAVSVVVSLKSNIQTTGQDENGVWQLKVD